MTWVNSVPFNPALQCQVERLAYHFNGIGGCLYMPPNQCCDMRACIDLFEKIDPKVATITTYAGNVEDTWAERDAEGWEIFPAGGCPSWRLELSRQPSMTA